jgi:hypothetical protein
VTEVLRSDRPVLKTLLPSSHTDSDTMGDEEFVPATTFMGDVTDPPFLGVQMVTEGSVEFCGHGGIGVRKKSSSLGKWSLRVAA